MVASGQTQPTSPSWEDHLVGLGFDRSVSGGYAGGNPALSDGGRYDHPGDRAEETRDHTPVCPGRREVSLANPTHDRANGTAPDHISRETLRHPEILDHVPHPV